MTIKRYRILFEADDKDYEKILNSMYDAGAFDIEFLESYVTDEEETPVTVYLETADGTDKVIEDNSWVIKGENLYHNDDLMIEGVLDDNEELISTIVEDYMHYVVKSIEVDTQEIYKGEE